MTYSCRFSSSVSGEMGQCGKGTPALSTVSEVSPVSPCTAVTNTVLDEALSFATSFLNAAAIGLPGETLPLSVQVQHHGC